MYLYEFDISLVYRISSGRARFVQRNLFKKQNKTKSECLRKPELDNKILKADRNWELLKLRKVELSVEADLIQNTAKASGDLLPLSSIIWESINVKLLTGCRDKNMSNMVNKSVTKSKTGD